MILLKLLLAIVGLGIIAISLISFFAGLTEEMGFIVGLIGVAIVFGIFQRESISEFFGLSSAMLDKIAFGALLGGGILCQMDFGKLGGAMVTAGWVAIGMILLQVIPIPFIANLVEIASVPFTVACIPLLLILLLFIGL